MKHIIINTSLLIVFTSWLSCRKAVEVPPPITVLVSTSVFSTNVTAEAAVNGIYLSMASSSVGGGRGGISALLGLSADEFTLDPENTDIVLHQLYTNSLLSNNGTFIWSDLYNEIYQANAIIEGLANSSGVTPSVKKQLTGEAKFIRAFCHFYLVNIYGDVPLVTTTDYRINALLPRSPKAKVYQQIVADLQDAQALLSDSYLAFDGTVTTERVRPNKGTATALLARVYLYQPQPQWPDAETQATAVINNANYSLLTNLDGVFLANSSEALWQLEMPNNGGNTPDGSVFLLSLFGGPSASYPFMLNTALVNSFEPGDARYAHWIGTYVDSTVPPNKKYYFPYKYKLNFTGAPPAEFPTLFRLAEQYLIRAEARAEQGNITGAQADLNAIRNRAGLGNTTAATQSDLLAAILKERRVELFTEYGHRWQDMKRTGNADAIMGTATPLKGGIWKPTDQLYPIPLSEIKSDGNLTQNPGYN